MTRKVYKSAMGKEVDLGALLLQNEQTRAVGNMNVNARGDLLDGSNRVIDSKNRQVQRQYKKNLSNVSSDAVVHSSNRTAKQSAVDEKASHELEISLEDSINPEEVLISPEPVDDPIVIPPTGEGGLAAAIARSRLIKQEKEKTLREKAREQSIKRI